MSELFATPGFWLAFALVGLPFLYLAHYVLTEAWRRHKYDDRGICRQCGAPFVSFDARMTDQMYGSGVSRRKCANGHWSAPTGDRHFAEW